MADIVENQRVNREGLRRTGLAGAGETGDPREQFAKGEWLGKVIIRAGVEPGDDMGLGIAGCKHKHGRRIAVVTEFAHHLPAVHARQHQVEQNDVKGMLASEGDAVEAVQGSDHGVTVFAKAIAQQIAHPSFIFDDENSHEAALREDIRRSKKRLTILEIVINLVHPAQSRNSFIEL
jgi:hypothetical protein